MNPTSNKLSGVLTILACWKSRGRLIPMMYFGVIHVLVTRGGKKLTICFARCNEGLMRL